MYIIHYEDSAFVSMVMNSLESFFLPTRNAMRGRKIERKYFGHEIFGHLWGTLEENGRHTVYTIKNCNIATTAKTTNGSAIVTTDVFFVKESINTHPYRAETIEERPPRSFLLEGCKPSKYDKESDPLEIPYMLDTILTISNRETCIKRKTQYINSRSESTIEFNIGKLFLILSANVRRNNKSYVQETEVKIEVPEFIKKDMQFDEDSIVADFLETML